MAARRACFPGLVLGVATGSGGGVTMRMLLAVDDSESVLRAAPCPVLCVPLPKKAMSEALGMTDTGDAAHA